MDSYLEIARKAALVSGEYLRKRENLDVVSSHGRDIRLAADLESERRIIEVIASETTMRILSEESGVIEGRSSKEGVMWIVDPLDGSYNYKNNIPLCCISIGLWNGNSPLLGVVYDFGHEEMFCGIVGRGAWLNDVSVEVSSVCDRSDAVLLTGFPVRSDYGEKELADFASDIYPYRKVRMIGSAALSLAYVAVGRADSYQEAGIMLWDIAGGLAVLVAAGGTYRILPYRNRGYCLSVNASNGRLDFL